MPHFCVLLVGLPETPPDVGVFRIGREPALESAFGGFVVLELDEYIGKTKSQGDGLVAVAQLEELLQGVAGALQIAFALVEPCQRFERTSVTRISREHRLVGFDRLADVAEARLVDVAEPYRQRQLGRVVTALFGASDLRAQELGELFVAPGLLVELGKVHDRVALGGVFVENAAQGFDCIVAGGCGL